MKSKKKMLTRSKHVSNISTSVPTKNQPLSKIHHQMSPAPDDLLLTANRIANRNALFLTPPLSLSSLSLNTTELFPATSVSNITSSISNINYLPTKSLPPFMPPPKFDLQASPQFAVTNNYSMPANPADTPKFFTTSPYPKAQHLNKENHPTCLSFSNPTLPI
jgi:hypothetical protein